MLIVVRRRPGGFGVCVIGNDTERWLARKLDDECTNERDDPVDGIAQLVCREEPMIVI